MVVACPSSMTYGGLPIMVPGADAQLWLENKLRPAEMAEFDLPTFPQYGQEHLPFRRPRDWPFRLNVLRWPVGAAEFATFHFLCDGTDVGKLRQQAYQSKYQPLWLTLESEHEFSGRAEQVSTLLWMLPPRHVSDIPGFNDLYLITLVDDRYFWWQAAAAINVLEGTTQWTDLYGEIGSALGITIDVDDIPDAYLLPSIDLGSEYTNLPTLLDAVAFSCGQRIVRGLDGSVSAQNPTTAIAQARKQVDWQVEAGGVFYFKPCTLTDLNALVPVGVTVVFPRADLGVVNGNKTIYSSTLASLQLPEFQGVVGYARTKVIRSNTIADWQGGGAPTNNDELQALAEQIAKDWYRWQLGHLDIKFAGIRQWTPEGLHHVEWNWLGSGVNTHVRRFPWNDRLELPGAAGSMGAVNRNPCLPVFANFVWDTPGPLMEGNTIEVPAHLEDPCGNPIVTDWCDVQITVTDAHLDATPSPTGATVEASSMPVGRVLEGNDTHQVRMRSQQGLYSVTVTGTNPYQYLWVDQSRNSRVFVKARDDVLQLAFPNIVTSASVFAEAGISARSVAVSGDGVNALTTGEATIGASASVIAGSGGGGGSDPCSNPSMCLVVTANPLADIPAVQFVGTTIIRGVPMGGVSNTGGLAQALTLYKNMVVGQSPSTCLWQGAYILGGSGGSPNYVVATLSYDKTTQVWTATLGTINVTFGFNIFSENIFSQWTGNPAVSSTFNGNGSIFNFGFNHGWQNTASVYVGSCSTQVFGSPPTVILLNPTAGPTTGGTTVTITGTSFTGATQVSFGSVKATSFTVNSDSQIIAVDPAEPPGTVEVTVENAVGISGATPADLFTYYVAIAPRVTHLVPSSSLLSGGVPVTITGVNFTGATQVMFGSVPAISFIVNSDTQITAINPPETDGTVDVTVTTPGGTSAIVPADEFLYVGVPTITQLIPNYGPTAGGTTVTILGENLVSPTGIGFGTAWAPSFTAISISEIIAISPAQPAGPVDTQAHLASGLLSILAESDVFTYTDQPVTVTKVNPNKGPVGANTTVAITGTNFTGVTAVNFGSLTTTDYTVNSTTQITAVTPAESAGTVDVRVTANGVTSAITAADEFTFGYGPVVHRVGKQPAGNRESHGPLSGGTTVTISGTNIITATAVYFGSTAATSFGRITDPLLVSEWGNYDLLYAISPAESAGTVDVTVVTPLGTSPTMPDDTFTFVGTPVVTSIDVNTGPTEGGTAVNITGSNFTGATAVSFGLVNATSFLVESDTQINVTSPAQAAGTVDITVTNPNGTSSTSLADEFTYVAYGWGEGNIGASASVTNVTAVSGEGSIGATASMIASSLEAASAGIGTLASIVASSLQGAAGNISGSAAVIASSLGAGAASIGASASVIASSLASGSAGIAASSAQAVGGLQLIQSTSGNYSLGAGGSQTITISAATVGSTIAIVLTAPTDGTATISVTSPAGSVTGGSATFSTTINNGWLGVFWCKSTSAGTSVKILTSGSASTGKYCIMEFAGGSFTATKDKFNSAATNPYAGSAAISSGATGTLSNSVEVVVGAISTYGAAHSFTGVSGLANAVANTAATGFWAGYEIVSSTASKTLTATDGGGGADTSAEALIISFK